MFKYSRGVPLRSASVLRVSRRDSIGVVCHEIKEAAPGSQMWLVVPWRWSTTRQLLNLRRLRHAAQEAAVDLRLVTRHLSTKQLAREAGLAVRNGLPLRLIKYAHRTDRVGRRRTVQVSETLPKRFSHSPRRLRIGAALLTLLVILFLAVALLASVVAFLPSAVVVIQPVAQPVSTTLDVGASPLYRGIDYGQAIIPARSVQVIIESRGDIPTTGSVDVADGYATGTVVLANRTDSPVTVPQGTIVRSSSGINVRFYTLASVDLPGQLYAHAEVPIMAEEAGPESNLRALTINVVEGELGTVVDCINGSPTQGGTVRRAAIVDDLDFDRLRATMIERLQTEAYAQLVTELDADEFIPRESLDVQVMAKHFDDQPTETISMDMKVVARGIAISHSDLELLGGALVESLADPGHALIKDSLTAQVSGDIDVTGQEASFSCDVSGYVSQQIDIARVRKALLAKPVQDGLDWIASSFALSSPPQITISPPMWEYLPVLPARIDVVIAVGDPS